jgi:hypothetical protein
MAEATQDLRPDDARLINTISNVVEKMADSISHKLHPTIEQYAQLFNNGARRCAGEGTAVDRRIESAFLRL